ncbi:MAG: IS5 family transposase [Paludibacter sp.]|nr:IS5 family transposase [Paludibacter sp.]
MTEKCLFEKFFDDFYKLLRNNNLILNQGVIIDGSFVEILRQRSTREENNSIKEGRGDELWNEEEIDNEEDKKKKSNKKRHKDTDARWTKKGGQKFYGYKTHTKIDAKSKLIKKSVTTSAEQHNSVPTKLLIDSDDYGQELYADSAYIGKKVKNLMRRFGMKYRVIKRKVKGRELSKRQATLNRKNASPRARVEHVFGYCEQSMHGMVSHAVGFVRNAARNILTSLVYNMLRYEQIQRLGMN